MTSRTPARIEPPAPAACQAIGALAADDRVDRGDRQGIGRVIDRAERARRHVPGVESAGPGRCSGGRRRRGSRCAGSQPSRPAAPAISRTTRAACWVGVTAVPSFRGWSRCVPWDARRRGLRLGPSGRGRRRAASAARRRLGQDPGPPGLGVSPAASMPRHPGPTARQDRASSSRGPRDGPGPADPGLDPDDASDRPRNCQAGQVLAEIEQLAVPGDDPHLGRNRPILQGT